MNYKQAYIFLFNQIEIAIEMLYECKPLHCLQTLVMAQQITEEMYIENSHEV